MVIDTLYLLVHSIRIELTIIAEIHYVGDLVLFLKSLYAAVCDMCKASCTEQNVLLDSSALCIDITSELTGIRYACNITESLLVVIEDLRSLCLSYGLSCRLLNRLLILGSESERLLFAVICELSLYGDLLCISGIAAGPYPWKVSEPTRTAVIISENTCLLLFVLKARITAAPPIMMMSTGG